MLDPDIVLREDRGGGTIVEVRGAENVARRAMAAASQLDLVGRPALINGAPGWFRNPDGELKRLVGSIEEAKLYGRPPQGNGHSSQAKITDIVRDEHSSSGETLTIPKYETADFQITFHGEFYQASPGSLADVMAKIVEVESPIHVQELSRRVTEAAYITRTGSRIRAVIEAAIRSAVRRRKVVRRGDFLWHPEMQKVPLRDRSELPDASKKLEFVAPEEIEVAIEKMVAVSYGLPRTSQNSINKLSEKGFE